ncbi:MAG: phage tail tape measure protein, partial [Clostridia bacterium]|nr:phage tail tape measure protein [Clostridia bacterium]
MADVAASLLIRIDAEDNASAVLAKVSNSVGSLGGAGAAGTKSVKGLNAEMNAGRKAANDMSNELTKSEKSLKRWQDAGAGLKSVGEGLDAVTKPLQYAAVGVVTGGAAVSAAAMKYETAFTGVKKTVDGTPEQLQQVNTEIRAMSKNIPVSAAELANLAAVGGQLGVGVEDISKFTEVMAAMGVATNLSGEEGAASMARFLNVMGEDVNNIDRAGSAIVALGNNTATTEADIASMAVRMGKYGKTVGMNTQQVLGYSAALSSMGIEAQLGGSAIGRTWLDIEKAVNSGGDTLNAYAKYAGVSAQDFAKQWSTDPSGAFNGLIKGLSSVENLTGAMSEMGIENTQDQQVVMALANGYDMLTKCLDLSGTAYKENTALMKEANAAYGTTANQIQLTKNAVTDAAISWGEVLLPEIRSGAQYVGGLADKFGSLDDNTKKTVVSGAKAAVVLGAASKATVGAIKGVGNVAEGVSKIKTAFAAGGAFAKFAPALASVASAAGPATAGIAAVTLAVVAGKKAYDYWYDSTYKWGESLEKPTVKLNESISTMKELNNLQWEYNDLSGKISKGQLDGKELEYAKSR